MRGLHKYLLVLTALSSCSDNMDNAVGTFDETPAITLITSTTGLGDNGYNDGILAGVMNFYESNDVRLSLIAPNSLDEARSVITSWISNDAKGRQLMILASSEYVQLAKEKAFEPDNLKTLLLLESDSLTNIKTFRIQRYGVSYLAGCMASPHAGATVIGVFRNEPTQTDAITGFTDGYEKYSTGKTNIIYLANDYSGFAMPDSAYRLASTLGNTFVYPLAGGSNNGIYKYTREKDFELMLVAGMDADCSAYSSRIPFSVVIRTDKIMENYLNMWFNKQEIPQHNVYGLESGYIDIRISPLFNEMSYIWDDYYLDTDYWKNAYDKYKKEALRKEEEYEAE